MKALMIYYTMGGRTKKAAETIAESLPQFDTTFSGFELIGSYIGKIKIMDKYEHEDFTLIDEQLNSLNAEGYDLILIGMPTYGDRPPKVFNEVIKRINNFKGKKVVVFSTARFSGSKNLQYMVSEIETEGAKVVLSYNLRALVRISKRKIMNLVKKITEIEII